MLEIIATYNAVLLEAQVESLRTLVQLLKNPTPSIRRLAASSILKLKPIATQEIPAPAAASRTLKSAAPAPVPVAHDASTPASPSRTQPQAITPSPLPSSPMPSAQSPVPAYLLSRAGAAPPLSPTPLRRAS